MLEEFPYTVFRSWSPGFVYAGVLFYWFYWARAHCFYRRGMKQTPLFCLQSDRVEQSVLR